MFLTRSPQSNKKTRPNQGTGTCLLNSKVAPWYHPYSPAGTHSLICWRLAKALCGVRIHTPVLVTVGESVGAYLEHQTLVSASVQSAAQEGFSEEAMGVCLHRTRLAMPGYSSYSSPSLPLWDIIHKLEVSELSGDCQVRNQAWA